jgi:hypothetical protein
MFFEQVVCAFHDANFFHSFFTAALEIGVESVALYTIGDEKFL